MSGLTHIDAEGAARMVDVAGKAETARVALAEGHLRMAPATLALLTEGRAPKGDVLATARIAGIMAAKRTADLIPLCHPLALTRVAVDLAPDVGLPGVRIRATVGTTGRTGVEMEALTAVSVAALTLYDMLKAAERGMEIGGIRVLRKEGGASGHWEAEPQPWIQPDLDHRDIRQPEPGKSESGQPEPGQSGLDQRGAGQREPGGAAP